MTKAELTKALKGCTVKELREKCLEMEMDCYQDDAVDTVRCTLEGKHPLMPLPTTRKGIIDEIASWLDIKRSNEEDVVDELKMFGFMS